MVFSLNLDGGFESVRKSCFSLNDSGKDTLIFSDKKAKKKFNSETEMIVDRSLNKHVTISRFVETLCG